MRARLGEPAYIAIPRDWLPSFEEAGGPGRLDEILRAYLGMPPSGRRLASAAQAAAPGIHDEIGPGLLLLPGGRDPGPISPLMQASAADPTVQVAASSPSGGTAITALAGARPGKAPSTVVEVTETSRSIPWLLIALVTALIAVIVGVVVLVTGGSGNRGIHRRSRARASGCDRPSQGLCQARHDLVGDRPRSGRRSPDVRLAANARRVNRALRQTARALDPDRAAGYLESRQHSSG